MANIDAAHDATMDIRFVQCAIGPDSNRRCDRHGDEWSYRKQKRCQGGDDRRPQASGHSTCITLPNDQVEQLATNRLTTTQDAIASLLQRLVLSALVGSRESMDG